MNKLLSYGLVAIVFHQIMMAIRLPSGLAPEPILAAQAMLRGDVPYRDFQFHAMPLLPVLFAGILAIPKYLWFGLLFSGMNLVTAWAIYKIALCYWNGQENVVAPLLFLATIPFWDGNAMYPETAMMMFGMLAFYFYHMSKSWPMIGCLILAVLTKQSGILYALALFPFLTPGERKRTFLAFLVVGLAAIAALTYYDALEAFMNNAVFMMTERAITDDLDRAGIWIGMFTISPALFFAVFFARGVQRLWILAICLFLAQNALAPQSHYFMPIIPFLCLILSTAAIQMPKWAVVVTVALSLVSVARVGMSVVRPFGAFGLRPFGMMDDYAIVEILKKEKIKQPVWVDRPSVYFLMDWKLPANNFWDQIDGGRSIKWTVPPYKAVKTRIYCINEKNSEQGEEPGWRCVNRKLRRGQYDAVRICRKDQ